MMKVFFIFICLLIPLRAQTWAEETLTTLSLDEKIGQLFLMAGYVDSDFAAQEGVDSRVDKMIATYHIGGIVFVGPSSCAKQTVLTNTYQQLSKIPLLIAQDLEWGLGMRHADGMSFPKNTTLGALDDNHLIYEMGKEIGRQAKLIGVHMNLSPVLDVNIEPENIVINVRSFGNSPQKVAAKGNAMIQGLQEAGIIASAKHFPGLGDIDTDPHLALPCSSHGKKRFQEVELYPFAQAIQAGVLSIQTEHLIVPAFDPKHPASLSPLFVTDILKKELGFTGLILSGALRMKALTQHFSQEEIAVKAFLAGNDMLLMPQDLSKAFHAIKCAVAKSQITEKELDERVLKILTMKEKVGLHQRRIVPIPTYEQLHTPHAIALKQHLYEKALTVMRGQIPSLAKKRIVYVQIGESSTPLFCEQLKQSAHIFPLIGDISEQIQRLLAELDSCDQVLLAVYPADPRRIAEIRLLDQQRQREELKHFRVHGIPASIVQLIHTLQPYQDKMIVLYFGNPFGIAFFEGYSNLIMAYEPDPDAQRAVISLLEKGPLLRDNQGHAL